MIFVFFEMFLLLRYLFFESQLQVFPYSLAEFLSCLIFVFVLRWFSYGFTILKHSFIMCLSITLRYIWFYYGFTLWVYDVLYAFTMFSKGVTMFYMVLLGCNARLLGLAWL